MCVELQPSHCFKRIELGECCCHIRFQSLASRQEQLGNSELRKRITPGHCLSAAAAAVCNLLELLPLEVGRTHPQTRAAGIRFDLQTRVCGLLARDTRFSEGGGVGRATSRTTQGYADCQAYHAAIAIEVVAVSDAYGRVG